VVISISGEW